MPEEPKPVVEEPAEENEEWIDWRLPRTTHLVWANNYLSQPYKLTNLTIIMQVITYIKL
jgi:hypothetical protein